MDWLDGLIQKECSKIRKIKKIWNFEKFFRPLLQKIWLIISLLFRGDGTLFLIGMRRSGSERLLLKIILSVLWSYIDYLNSLNLVSFRLVLVVRILMGRHQYSFLFSHLRLSYQVDHPPWIVIENCHEENEWIDAFVNIVISSTRNFAKIHTLWLFLLALAFQDDNHPKIIR